MFIDRLYSNKKIKKKIYFMSILGFLKMNKKLNILLKNYCRILFFFI